MSAVGSIAAVAGAARADARGRRARAPAPRGVRSGARAPTACRASTSDASETRVPVPIEADASADASPPTRRAVVSASLAGAASAFLVPALAAFAEDEDEDEDAAQAAIEASMKDVLKRQSGEQTFPRQTAFGSYGSGSGVMQASFEVSSLWSVIGKQETKSNDTNSVKSHEASWSSIIDPVNGKVVQGVYLFHSPKYATASIENLGKPENVSVAKALGLDNDDTYRRADMLGSARRVAKDGQVYYDWEMVASPPPKDCPSAVGCLYPDHIYLMSATVRGGDLYVLSVDAFPENWRQAGNSLRRLRGSFEVRPEDIAPLESKVETEATDAEVA